METSNAPAPRTSLHLDVSFKKNYARQLSHGVLKNISLTGAFLDCRNENFRANEKIQLTFVVAGRERRIAATVVWANSAGCGVKFHPTSQRDVQIVDDLIYFVEANRDGRRDVLDNIFKKVG
ncbi:MAG: PilZ domain-containing protein [Bdellovibrionaceae bacterium]|nr:PilZ domain-containing protein [Pseudobdellovibrionaceae bacterium]MBX3033708.1 PilZ domain-containing protein [Pseudobdellovibrionaceae bacterium]